jgi:UDP-3-O-[3-hydroxymyristoyl] glucosamine N-acyltransferase
MQSAIKVTAAQLRSLEGPYLTWQGGSDTSSAVGVGTPDSLLPSQLAFVSNPQFLATALEKASLLIVEEKILPGTLDLRSDQALWSTPSLKAAMALVLPLFDPRRTVQDPLISPQAFLHPTAKIGVRTRVLPGAVIGAHAEIGDDCVIHSGAVVEAFCRVGSRCVIHANAVIGSDGYGYVTDPKGRHHKIPQIGIVVLEDEVEIGACTTIDRATLGETRIGFGTKFDNLCHVAHNCQIGKYGFFTAGFIVAGSTKIGDHFMCGGGTAVADHIEICDHVTLGGRSAVTKNITKPGAYTGFPVEPMRDGLRTLQNLTHLTEMRQQLRMVMKRLGLSEDSN